MGDVVDDESFELSAVPDDGVVEELSAQGADPAFGECVRDGRADRGLDDLMCSVGKISSKASVNWLPRSRTSALQARAARRGGETGCGPLGWSRPRWGAR